MRHQPKVDNRFQALCRWVEDHDGRPVLFVPAAFFIMLLMVELGTGHMTYSLAMGVMAVIGVSALVVLAGAERYNGDTMLLRRLSWRKPSDVGAVRRMAPIDRAAYRRF